MTHTAETESSSEKPAYVAGLEKAYGPPTDGGFGSAVFFERLSDKDDLEVTARKFYQQFVGPKWQEWGEETWMAPWKEVYRRKPGDRHAILQELKGIKDPEVSQSVPMILEVVEDAADARTALSAAYDPAEVSDLQVYTTGDGEAMSGLLVAGMRANGEATFLVFLMD